MNHHSFKQLNFMDVLIDIGSWTKLKEKFAEGHSIEPSKRGDFKKEIDRIRNDLNSGVNFFNEEAEKYVNE
jgi:hypothetical protein